MCGNEKIRFGRSIMFITMLMFVSTMDARAKSGDGPSANCDGVEVTSGYGMVASAEAFSAPAKKAVSRIPLAVINKDAESIFCGHAENTYTESKLKVAARNFKKRMGIPENEPIGSLETRIKCSNGHFGETRPVVHALQSKNEDFILNMMESEEFDLNAEFEFAVMGDKPKRKGTLQDFMQYWRDRSKASSERYEYIGLMMSMFWEEYGARKSCELNGTCSCSPDEGWENLECTINF